jgi:hypothetical protein
MNRGVTKDFQDKNLRPNLGDKEKLTRIVTSPAWNLATDDRDRMYDRELLWNFRYFLSADPKALIKVSPGLFCFVGIMFFDLLFWCAFDVTTTVCHVR